MREKLAELAHNQWSDWMYYLFSKGTFNEDGTWTMPEWAVNRWVIQIGMPYNRLSEKEKESDRKEADKFLAVFEEQSEDICGYCGETGADKMALWTGGGLYWPNEFVPETELVHSECENEETRRAHAVLSQSERDSFLRNIR